MLRHLTIAALIGAAISCTPKKNSEAETPEPASTGEVDVTPSNLVSLATNLGEIVIELDPDKAPISSANFLHYVDSDHYESSIFHRVIDGYVITAGKVHVDSDRFVEYPAGESIEIESRNGLRNDRGTIAMARGSRPDSATSSFFINLADNIGLNYPQPDGYGYAVFGKVVAGMEIADKIGSVETGIGSVTLLHPETAVLEPQEIADLPVEPVTILSAKRLPQMKNEGREGLEP